MKKINRRQFINRSTAGILTAALFTSIPNELFASGPLNMPIGFQSWTLRDKLSKDFAGTLKMMAGLGYAGIEMCSPLGYKDSGFGPLNNLKGSEMKKIIEDAGLICRSSHFNFDELRNNLDNRIEWSHQLGMTQMILSSFWLPDGTLDDYHKACDELNVIAGKINKAGFKTGYHNHNMEFEKRGDQLIYDAIMGWLDPDLVKMQFQVAVIEVGYKAADYFRKYPGRFISSHLADWSEKEKKQVPIGQGIVDWKEFFEAAKVGGIENFFVEMDPATFEESSRYLKNI